LWLCALPALARVPCSLPFNLQNGTTADASQVMANYTALVNCLANAAAAGNNADITALSALTTPLTPAQGATTVYNGGTSSGSAPIIITSTSPNNFTLTAGLQVTFIVGTGNSGPTQLNVASSGLKNFYRRTQLGISAMVGGELTAGHTVTAEYDGTEFQLITSQYLVGEIRDYAGSAAPSGWAFIDGSCLLRTTYADLFGLIGTTYDPTGTTCDTAHFALPDGRGRMLVGQDNMGVNGAANRITNAASGCVGTTLGGAGCGLQTHTQLLTELVAHNHTITDPGHVHGPGSGSAFLTNASGNQILNAGNAGTASTTALATTGIVINSTGGGTPMPILNPLQVVTKIIKL